MSRVWFTADLHLGHGNIIRHCLRPFLSPSEEELALENPRGHWRVSGETVQRHDDAILANINALVHKNATLWVLGDFCWGGPEVARRYRERIHCNKVNLVWGNHDRQGIAPLFGQVMEQGMIGIQGQDIWLNHYPMRSWNRSFRGSWHLYGHVHGRFVQEDTDAPWRLTKDVGVDACNYQPISYEELRAYMAPRVKALEKHRQKGADNDVEK